MSATDEFEQYVGAFITGALQVKSALMASGARDAGQFDCPKCGCKVTVCLVGRRDHIRARCSTYLCLSMVQ